jgi:thiamine kinase-like enzyme
MLPIKNLETLLAQTYGSDFQIYDLEWKPLTDPGENFGSLIFAININAEQNNKEKTLHLVVKLPPKTEYLLDLFDSPITFKKELEFYSIIAPEFLKLQTENGISQEDLSIIMPNFLGGRLGLKNRQRFDDQAAIALENLKYLDYTTKDRIIGLDRIHMYFAIGHLAKLHAMTIALKLQKPEFFKKNVLPSIQYVMNRSTKDCVLRMIKKSHEDYKGIKEAEPYLDKIEKTIEYGLHNIVTPQEPWMTYVHNDFWVNNMLFKYDKSDKLINMKIVDFQLSIYDYGVNDLIFFLISSSHKDVLDNHLDDMIDLYYDSFIQCLKSLNVDTNAFPKSQFLEQVEQCAPMKFNQCMMMTQVIQAARGTVAEMSQITNGDSLFTDNINDDNYIQKMLHTLFIFDRKGWLVN